MSEGPLPPLGRIDRSQGPWDTRSVAELSQTSFRTTLRGFDRSEVRAILDSIAADYRVLQLQNASLLRQLADLEGVLQAYRREEGTVDHALQRANDEARAILTRAQAQAEETMARVSAMVREAESPLAPIENGHGNIQRHAGLHSRRDAGDTPHGGTQSLSSSALVRSHPYPSCRTAPVSTAAATTKSEPAISNDTKRASGARLSRGQFTSPRLIQPIARNATRPLALSYPFRSCLAGSPAGLVAAAAPPSTTRDTAEPIEAILKKIDKAMLDIPSLTRE